MIILVFGLPGSGKTTLAKALAKLLRAVHWNADEVREMVNASIPGDSSERMEQARRMRFLCEGVHATGGRAIADFVCPTDETREAFGEAFTIYVDRIRPDQSRYADTRALFQPPKSCDVHYTVGMIPMDVIRKLSPISISTEGTVWAWGEAA